MGLIDSAIDAFRFKDTVFYKENIVINGTYNKCKKKIMSTLNKILVIFIIQITLIIIR